MKNTIFNDVCIIGGLGHIGLPLGILFASKRLKVCLYDIDNKNAQLVKKSIMPFKERGAKLLLKKVVANHNLRTSNDPQSISNSKYIIITIGNEYKNKYSEKNNLIKAINYLKKYIKKYQIIIIRSSVSPGTCKEILKLLNKRKDYHLAYCPERIKQGHSITELQKLPQIVSGFSKKAINDSSILFSKISPSIIKCEVLEAELIKLYTNAWRYIQFAVSNELYMLCENLGVEFNSIRKKIIYNYPRAKNMPTAGFAAGPCLYKDTIHLNNFHNNKFKLGKSAITINHNLPNFIVKQLSKNISLIKKTVGILGMAFKPDIDDSRNSLSNKLEKILKKNGTKVICSDEYIKNKKFVTKEELIDKSDIIIIGVPHRNYNKLNFKNKRIINIWGH